MPLITTFALGQDSQPDKYDLGILQVSKTKITISINSTDLNLILLDKETKINMNETNNLLLDNNKNNINI